MSFLILAYFVVAFVAGMVALAMPCCFSVLLPSYFAQSFKQRTRLLGMTLVFSLGIATVMLPIALGIVAIAQTITTGHNLIFVAGGFLMILIGFWTLWGQGMLPMLNLPVNLKRNNVSSVYTLGVFSGAATSCCAPVLAGVLVLTAFSTSLLEGLLVGFSYVLGMTSPLLAAAILWDKFAVKGENPLKGHMLQLNLLGRRIPVHSSKLIAGVMFVVMGVVTVILGLTGTMIPTPGSSLVGIRQAQFQTAIIGFFSGLGPLEGYSLVIGVAALAATALLAKYRLKRNADSVSEASQ